MRETGTPSTENVTVLSVEVCAPPGVVMLAPQTLLRNAEGLKSEGRARGRSIHKARPETV